MNERKMSFICCRPKSSPSGTRGQPSSSVSSAQGTPLSNFLYFGTFFSTNVSSATANESAYESRSSWNKSLTVPNPSKIIFPLIPYLLTNTFECLNKARASCRRRMEPMILVRFFFLQTEIFEQSYFPLLISPLVD